MRVLLSALLLLSLVCPDPLPSEAWLGGGPAYLHPSDFVRPSAGLGYRPSP